MRDFPIKFLLIAGFLISGLIPLMVVALMSVNATSEELTYQAFRQLESVRDIKKNQVQFYFEERINQTEILAANPHVHRALKEFSALVDGPLGRQGLVGHGAKLFDAPPSYLNLHERYQPFFRTYQEGSEYYDVFLMSAEDGFTYFTVEKEADFGIAIAQVDSSLNDVWMQAATQKVVTLSDIRPYAPSGNIPAQFIAAPVIEEGELIGVVAVQISLDLISEIMSERSGLGETGETYLVGPDFRMRSHSYLDPQGRSVEASFAGSIEENGARTQATEEAFAGHAGAQIIQSYNGHPVLSAYAPVKVQGVTWAIVSEIGEAEIQAKISAALDRRITITLFLSLVLLLLLALSISVFINRGIEKVNSELNSLMDGVLSGEEDRRVNPNLVPHDFRGVVAKTNALVSAYQVKNTENQELEAAIAYNQRMEAIGTLAGGIAHDFNNILAYMLTYGDMVLDKLPEDELAHSWMQEILGGIDRASELVAQIMTFGRQVNHEKRPVEVALLVKEAIKLLKATVPKSIRLQCTINAPKIKVLADPHQLHRIIMNLCTNALHAMHGQGGKMEVTVEQRLLNEDDTKHGLAAGDYCLLSVCDTGCGIEEAIMERIFDPFFTTKPIGQGSGMGLAVVHGIVASIGGSIYLESQKDEGTQAKVLIPLFEDPTENQAPKDQTLALQGRGRILFVDDEEKICRSMAIMLESLGYEVLCAHDPKHALKRFADAPGSFDALITDVNMPEINGLALARQIFELRPELPIIISTGYNELLDSEETLRELNAELLLKPFDKCTLSKILASRISAMVKKANDS